MSELRAGVACGELDPPLGVPMMGYAARVGVAEGVHDPLRVRALHLSSGSDLLWVECDVCLFAPQQLRGVRTRLAAETGIAAERILVGSIHTHSGPDTGFGALLAGEEPPAYVAGLLDRIVETGVRAWRGARPARLGWGRAEAGIGRNRRLADGPLDREVLVLRVDAAEADGPLAILYVHGCHATALGHDNLLYSADWPGAAAAEIRARFPQAIPIFALGAHADVDPRTRGLQDLAIADQSVGVSPAETEALGREIGAAVADAAETIPLRADAPIAAGSVHVSVPARRPSEEGRAAALAAVGLPADARPKVGELFALEGGATRDLPDAERREAVARVRAYLRDRTARRFAFGEAPEVEVQLLRIGDARLLGLPLEPTVDVGLDWKRRTSGTPAAVLGIANGWMRYLPHRKNYEEPDAHVKYEILQATLVPDASDRLLEAGEELARALG